jgi:hypothetical protein
MPGTGTSTRHAGSVRFYRMKTCQRSSVGGSRSRARPGGQMQARGGQKSRACPAYAGIRSRLPGETGSRNRNLLAYRLAGFNLLRRVFPTVAEASARAAAEHTTNDRPAIAGRENNSASSRLAESIVSHRPGIWPMAGPLRGSRMRSEHMGHSQPTVIAVGSALWIISTSFSGMKKGSEGFGGIGEDGAFGVLRVADRNNARMRGYFNALSVPHAAARLTPGDSAVAGIYR